MSTAGPRWGDGEVTVDDRWTYRWAARRRPFVHPLRTPVGHVLTVDAPADHPWHHGLWFSVKYIDGDNFWEEMAPYGVIRHLGDPPLVVTESDDAISLAGRLDWVAPDRETVVLQERRTLTRRTVDATAVAIDWETVLEAPTDVLLDRTPYNGTWGGYGGLAFRGAPTLTDTTLRVADAAPTERLVGVRARWLDLAGTVDGAPVGVTILDAPDNPSHPVAWYASTRASTYGEGWANFVSAAFLWDGPHTLVAGTPLTFRYRVLAHDGRWDPEHIDALWDAYVSSLEPTGKVRP